LPQFEIVAGKWKVIVNDFLRWRGIGNTYNSLVVFFVQFETGRFVMDIKVYIPYYTLYSDVDYSDSTVQFRLNRGNKMCTYCWNSGLDGWIWYFHAVYLAVPVLSCCLVTWKLPVLTVGWNFQVWKLHKFREFFEIFQDPLFEIFIEILYFNYNSPITRKNVSQV